MSHPGDIWSNMAGNISVELTLRDETFGSRISFPMIAYSLKQKDNRGLENTLVPISFKINAILERSFF